jgi:hypothetical protein
MKKYGFRGCGHKLGTVAASAFAANSSCRARIPISDASLRALSASHGVLQLVPHLLLAFDGDVVFRRSH